MDRKQYVERSKTNVLGLLVYDPYKQLLKYASKELYNNEIPDTTKGEKIIEGFLALSEVIVKGTRFESRFELALADIRSMKRGTPDLQRYARDVINLQKCLSHIAKSENSTSFYSFSVPGSEGQIMLRMKMAQECDLSISNFCTEFENITHEDYNTVGKTFLSMKDSI